MEHDPNEILRCTFSVIKKLLEKSRIHPSQIAAIGITNQRETTILWDRVTGKPLHRAIVWQDRRTTEICERLKREGCDSLFRRKTGLVLDPYFSGTKVHWLIRHSAAVRRMMKSGKALFGTVDSWLLWHLTGGRAHATDYSNASRTLLFNIRSRRWDTDLMKILSVPTSCLPEAKPSVSLFGKTSQRGPLPAGIPIHAIAGDQQAALYGQACYDEGTMKNTYGTGCFAVLNMGDRCVLSKHGLLTTLACDAAGNPVYALEGSIFIAGAVIQWVRDGLAFIRDARETERMASSLEDTGGVYVVPAFVGLGAPYWDSRARGAILGLTRGTRREHIVKAALESIAFQTVDVIETMKKDSRLRIRELKVDGGATKNNYLMQFQADVLGIRIRRTSLVESTAWGVAKLAGVGSGFWQKPTEVDSVAKYDTFSPRQSPSRRRELYRGWQDSVARVLTRKL